MTNKVLRLILILIIIITFSYLLITTIKYIDNNNKINDLRNKYINITEEFNNLRATYINDLGDDIDGKSNI